MRKRLRLSVQGQTVQCFSDSEAAEKHLMFHCYQLYTSRNSSKVLLKKKHIRSYIDEQEAVVKMNELLTSQ